MEELPVPDIYLCTIYAKIANTTSLIGIELDDVPVCVEMHIQAYW
jgi:hypothetical protein